MAQIAVEIDQEGPKNPLQGEEAYFDGAHSCRVCYKLLVLLVYHPAMWQILRIAMMEENTESTQEISFFWKLLNAVLSKIMER